MSTRPGGSKLCGACEYDEQWQMPFTKKKNRTASLIAVGFASSVQVLRRAGGQSLYCKRGSLPGHLWRAAGWKTDRTAFIHFVFSTDLNEPLLLCVSLCFQFLERMQLEYHAEAAAKGVYVIGSCGFDSIPADLGIVYTQRHFKGRNKTSSRCGG